MLELGLVDLCKVFMLGYDEHLLEGEEVGFYFAGTGQRGEEELVKVFVQGSFSHEFFLCKQSRKSSSSQHLPRHAVLAVLILMVLAIRFIAVHT